MVSIDFIINYDIIVKDMKTYFFNLFIAILTLVGAIGCATSNTKPRVFVAEEESSDTESGGRWVADKGEKGGEKVVTNSVTTAVSTNNNLKLSENNWKVTGKVLNPGFQPEQAYTPIPISQEPQEQAKRRSFIRSFFSTPSTPMLTDGVSQSSLPPNPVRRSYRSFTLPTMWGTYNYSHSQGTDNSASRYWDDYGPHEEVRQSTYQNTSESFYPERRRWVAPTYYQQYQGSQGIVTWP